MNIGPPPGLSLLDPAPGLSLLDGEKSYHSVGDVKTLHDCAEEAIGIIKTDREKARAVLDRLDDNDDEMDIDNARNTSSYVFLFASFAWEGPPMHGDVHRPMPSPQK